ncbi:MAG TPA: metal ABC transporter permease [Dehalococcoidia bacterium]|nr:metal ABC transporter permease [Dehalococcoidia bacterium]
MFLDLFAPFDYEFFRHGLLAATLVGGLCGLVGAFVVLRKMSYIGHGMSHAVFGGAVVGYVLGWNFYLIAGAWGFVAALLINQTTKRRQIGADAAIGIVTTASFAFGVALISRAHSFTRNFDAALFGNLLGVTNTDLAVIAGVSAATLLVIFFAYKQLLFLTFDPEVAGIYGVPTGAVDALFALVLAAAIIVSINVMGVTLIAAALVIPPVIARLFTDSFAKMLILATLLGALTGFAGIYTSYYTDVASGATIVLFSAALFVVVLAFVIFRARLRLQRGIVSSRLALSVEEH